jgi:hypothetical protein
VQLSHLSPEDTSSRTLLTWLSRLSRDYQRAALAPETSSASRSMTSRCQRGEEATEDRFIHGVNWAPDNDDDMEDLEARDAACALLHLASREVWRFVDEKARHEMVELMLPALHPLVYGDHEDDVNDAVTTLLWIGRGYVCN